MNPTVGYSGTPLAKKLGIKANFKIKLVQQPDYYFELFTDLPAIIVPEKGSGEMVDFIHFFTAIEREYIEMLPQLKAQIVQNGMIWISWPKKASKVKTDLTENTIRSFALQTGLVDVKVCAIDQTWSGLKLVIRVKDRIG